MLSVMVRSFSHLLTYAKRASIEEIHTLRVNLKQARQDQQSLETQLRELRSAESSTKVRHFHDILVDVK